MSFYWHLGRSHHFGVRSRGHLRPVFAFKGGPARDLRRSNWQWHAEHSQLHHVPEASEAESERVVLSAAVAARRCALRSPTPTASPTSRPCRRRRS